jgi:hypothetical protein
MMEIDRERFITLCEDFELRSDSRYSGRGMYGGRCVGVEVRNPGDIIKFLYLVVPQIDPNFEYTDQHSFMNYSPEWEDIRSDSMGHNKIYYWPKIQAVNLEDAQDTLI